MDSSVLSSKRDLFTFFFQDILDSEYEPPEKETLRGQPMFYKTPQELASAAIDYFVMASESLQPLRVTGFILFSKLNTRQGLDNYKKFPPFELVVNRIKMIIEDFNVSELYTQNIHGAKFVLQCGFGYVPIEGQKIETHVINLEIGRQDDEETQ